jgi:hypothetical protein
MARRYSAPVKAGLKARRVSERQLKNEAGQLVARADRLDWQWQSGRYKRTGRVREQHREAQELRRAARRVTRQAERESARTSKISATLRKSPAKRTSYERRVASRVVRQAERGEPLSLSRGRGSLDARLIAYAVKLQDAYGDKFTNVGGYLLTQPRQLQLRILNEVELLHQEYVEGEYKPLGRSLDLLYAYH